MASISSVISLFVLLLATYCYSVPIGTEFEYSTVDSEFVTGKTFGERDLFPFTASFEETTVEPLLHVHQTRGVISDDSVDSDELTTERSSLTGIKHPKRTFVAEAERSVNQRSFEDEPSERSVNQRSFENERSERSVNQRSFENERSERSMDERSFETRSADNVLTDETTESELGSHFHQARGGEHIDFDMTTSDVPSEESKVPRGFDADLMNTVESSTEFNSRAIRFMEHGVDESAYTEPTSSFESLAHSTGLLHSRTMPESNEHRFEGAREEDFTTFHPHH